MPLYQVGCNLWYCNATKNKILAISGGPAGASTPQSRCGRSRSVIISRIVRQSERRILAGEPVPAGLLVARLTRLIVVRRGRRSRSLDICKQDSFALGHGGRLLSVRHRAMITRILSM